MDDVPGAKAPSGSAPRPSPGAPSSLEPGSAPGLTPDPWLALALAAPLAPAVCRRLNEAFPTPDRLRARLAEALGPDRRAARRARTALAAPHGPLTPAHVAALDAPLTRRRVAEALEWLARDTRHHLVPIDDPRYPASLRATLDPPPLLHLHGDPAALAGPAVAVVGSRDASHAGLERARALAHDLAASGLVVASGLALGTDGAAHAGALDGARATGAAPTIAWVGTGVDIVYPRRHARLAAALLERGGAMVSEFTLRHPPQPWCFPQRNRLISGASLGVVVIEAALPSGSLTTARHALEQGREVMAVPGAVDDPRSAGCHALIRDGAALVTSAADVLGVLAVPLRRALEEGGPDATDTPPAAGYLPVSAHATPASDASARHGLVARTVIDGDATARRVLDCLASGPATLERLVVRSGLAVPRLLATLGELELSARVVVERDGRYARRTP